MRGKTFPLFMAIFWFLWTSVVIPAHTRGYIPLGKDPAGKAAARQISCPLCAMLSDNAGKSDQPSKPRNPANCAICNLAAHLSVSTGFVLIVPRQGVLGWLVMKRGADAVYGLEPGLPVGSRAPPALPPFSV